MTTGYAAQSTRSIDALLERARAGDSVEIYASMKRVGVVMALSIGFIAAGVFALGLDTLKGRIYGVAGIALGVAALAAGAWLFATRGRPLMIFDSNGVSVRTIRNAWRVRWRDLGRAFIGSVRRQRFVCLVPRDLDAALAAADPVTRRVMSTTVALTGAPYALSGVNLTQSAEEILALVLAYAPELAPEGASHEGAPFSS
jgi:hypothetical protein